MGEVVKCLIGQTIPDESESITHATPSPSQSDQLANCYFAIVAICHQTTPVGENRLEGEVGGEAKVGWDYLKEKFLEAANADPSWATSEKWKNLRPEELARLYKDDVKGQTLNRVAERTALLNDLGNRLTHDGHAFVREAFEKHGNQCFGEGGFFTYLEEFEAFSDPLRKKSLFFMSIVQSECGWSIVDAEQLISPIDYHELRGHLRIGTLVVYNAELRRKLRLGLPLNVKEDLALREQAQEANTRIGTAIGVTPTKLHYLLWNVFRNCCPRASAATHCNNCGSDCKLPAHYKQLPNYAGKCIFSNVCQSAGLPDKITNPPYLGHFY